MILSCAQLCTFLIQSVQRFPNVLFTHPKQRSMGRFVTFFVFLQSKFFQIQLAEMNVLDHLTNFIDDLLDLRLQSSDFILDAIKAHGKVDNILLQEEMEQSQER